MLTSDPNRRAAIFTDVERLCNVHIPQWLASPGMAQAKIAAFYVEVIRDLSLEIGAGEFVVFLGPSGSGKTTLGKLLVRAIQPDSGSIIFDSVDQVLDMGEAEGAELARLCRGRRLFGASFGAVQVPC